MDNYNILGSGKRIKELDKSGTELLKKELINFESNIVRKWENAEIPYPVHLSGGNEEQLINIFRDIQFGDYVLSTHRGHYHYLLAGGKPERLERMILRGDSMHLFDKSINFMSSSIVAGMPAIAAGIAKAIKDKKKETKVWCFIGDGAEEEGHFYEAVRYVEGWQLPCNFIIEDNNRSVETPKSERYNRFEIQWPLCVRRYFYVPTYPHVGTQRFVNFSKNKVSDGEVGGTMT